MKRIFHVAVREFLATVLTKGFLFGVLMTPVLIGILVVFLPRLMNDEPPKIDGELAIVDPTGVIAGEVSSYLEPEAIALRRQEVAEQVQEAMPEGVRQLADNSGASGTAMQQALETALGTVPEISVNVLSGDVDVEAEKDPLLHGSVQDGGRLALLVIHPHAVSRGEDGQFGLYDLYIREKLDDRLVDEFQAAVRGAITTARVTAQGLDPDEINELTRLPRVKARAVTVAGERENTEVLNAILPAFFMLLLLMSSMSGGQYLMTTTIEEKSSRVVEVLLSAVSPMELMTGKIIGQLTVGFVILAIYAALGVAGLVSFSLLGLVDPMLIVYLLIFYVIAYFVMGSLMAAIGAAVNEMREAQTLMMPVMMTIMIPWVLWMPISRDPNSLFATIASMLPPINSFVMLLRMTSTTPPPLWQVWLSIAIGAASVYVAVWFAAKVFRIGILMHGKPPSFGTLVKWVRMA